MKKKRKIYTKILLVLSIILMSLLIMLNSVRAVEINSAHIYSGGDCGSLLKYKGVVVKVTYVQYQHNGVTYPAYCLDKTKFGVEMGDYNVSINDILKDVTLWRILINGYPYKSIEELGVANKEEAFTATKQAAYIHIHRNGLHDYEAIGEAGQRTLNAMHKIWNDANNSSQEMISNTININKNLEEWKVDNIDKNYLSKTYSVSAGAGITSYKITINRTNGGDLGGIELTDINNVEKQEFSSNEKFKVLVPIQNMTEEGEYTLSVDTKIETKPVLYGVAPNSEFQDYALTAGTYEDGKGEIKDVYPKNETKIIIEKQDEDTKEKLEGVEFEVLNENKNVVYANLKTNEEGKIEIENLAPGKYFLKETKTIDGYQIYTDLIEVNIELNEVSTVIINNRKEEKPVPVIENTKQSVTVKRLPVAGI